MARASQQIRLPTPLSQANKFHFARFSSYTIKTYWTRTFPYSITNISILIQGYDWEVTGTNRTNLAWILFWSEFFTTVLLSLFPVNTCKWERIHHQHHHHHHYQHQWQHQHRYGLRHLGIYCHGLQKLVVKSKEIKTITTWKIIKLKKDDIIRTGHWWIRHWVLENGRKIGRVFILVKNKNNVTIN